MGPDRSLLGISRPSTKRIPGLDGLRAVSILGVLLCHVQFSPHFPKRIWLRQILDHGSLGVTIFFALSGFLITTLLLNEEANTGRINLRKFYLRRSLRILPPAYIYLAGISAFTLLGLLHVRRTSVLWSAIFLGNFHVSSPETAHFWSLAVEEQFYLILPLMVVLLPRRSRLPFTTALLVLSFIWKGLSYDRFGDDVSQYRFDINCDALLAGCIIALARDIPSFLTACRSRLLQNGWTPIVAALLIVAGCIPHLENQTFLRAFIETGIAVLIAIIINYVIEEHANAATKLLNAPLVTWLGKLSFSLYLWQQVFCFTRPRDTIVGQFPLNILLAFLAAIASYHLIELPILRLRQRLDAKPTSAPVDENTASSGNLIPLMVYRYPAAR